MSSAPAEVIWHDLECGGFDADLGLWEELADAAGGPILDLGCGTGRVALHLARRGHAVHGLDLDPGLIAALEQRAAGAGVELTATPGDARAFDLDPPFALVLAPMQLLQVLAGAEDRIACLECVRRHLEPGGRVAAAIVDGFPDELTDDAGPPLPDARELDGWIYSSLPLDAGLDGDTIFVRRLRQTVSPAGELDDELDEVSLRLLRAETIEVEAGRAGLVPAGRRQIPPTDLHVGSTVLLLENPG